MAIKFKDLGKKVRRTEVEYDGEKFFVEYRPNAATTAESIALQEASEDGGGAAVRAVVDYLCKMLVSWEVIDDNGEMMGITPDFMLQLPMPLLTSIAQAIGEDQNPNATKSGR